MIVVYLSRVVVFSFMHYALQKQGTHYHHVTGAYPEFLWYAMSVVWMVPENQVIPISQESNLLSGIQYLYCFSLLVPQTE